MHASVVPFGKGQGGRRGSLAGTAASRAPRPLGIRSYGSVRRRSGRRVRGRGVRCRRRTAVAVVRRGRDDIRLDTVDPPAVGSVAQHRCGARPVLPAHARVVHGSPGHRVQLPAVELPGCGCGRGRCRRPGTSLHDPNHGRVRGHRVRDPASRHMGGHRDPVLCADGRGSRVGDPAADRHRPAQLEAAVGLLRPGSGGVVAAEHLRRAAGSRARRGAHGGCGPACGGAPVDRDGRSGDRHRCAVPRIQQDADRPGPVDLAARLAHPRGGGAGAVFRPQRGIRRRRGVGAGSASRDATLPADGCGRAVPGADQRCVDRAPDGGAAALHGVARAGVLPAISQLHVARDGAAAGGRRHGRRQDAGSRRGGADRVGGGCNPELSTRTARSVRQGGHGLQPGRRRSHRARLPRRLPGARQHHQLGARADPSADRPRARKRMPRSSIPGAADVQQTEIACGTPILVSGVSPTGFGAARCCGRFRNATPPSRTERAGTRWSPGRAFAARLPTGCRRRWASVSSSAGSSASPRWSSRRGSA